MTHAEMIRRMSAAEYTRWSAFYLVEARDQKAAMDAAKKSRS